MTTTKKTQLRAICPVCFREQAVSGSRFLVQHGYERPEGWHCNVGTCAGTRHSHFGTLEGRGVAEKTALGLREFAVRRVSEAEKATTVTVRVRSFGGRNDKTEYVTSDDPRFPVAFANNLRRAEGDARGAREHADYIDRRVLAWEPTAPVEVEVQPAGTILHAVGAYWTKLEGRPIAACVSSIRSTGYKATTDDHSKVTCRACLKQLAAQAADKVERAAAIKLIDEMVAKYGESAKRCFTDANSAAIREIRYQRKDVDKNIRKRAADMLDRGIKV